jgi:hypothetical protein
MTYWSQTSFDSRLSERNEPPGSERSVTSFQNSVSDRRSGSLAGAGAGAGTDGGGGAGVATGAGGGAGTTAGGACFAQETGPVATISASNPAQTNRPDILSNRLTSQAGS